MMPGAITKRPHTSLRRFHARTGRHKHCLGGLPFRDRDQELQMSPLLQMDSLHRRATQRLLPAPCHASGGRWRGDALGCAHLHTEAIHSIHAVSDRGGRPP
jgi:hypothetical protein